MAFLYKVTVWHWWTLGVIFLILELTVPGAFFLWLAISAGIIGVLIWILPALSLIYQLLLFSTISVASVTLYLRFRSRTQNSSDSPILNRRADQYIGHVFTLENALENGQGKIQLGDTIWSIKGPNCNKGTRVKIVSAEGSILQVEIL
ncbi:NfeD family protein [Candidatus Paracaedibacter symbiosus]|uniref:NfeD family protein n=1 Tax=Candidatus Paracaedibacter symbiosus TaxID=244582 RepID=UPI0004F6875D|nr:NfeD family protein [Candidatus Paracaedibacter symbiosus]AIL12908.1 hypothetical protein IM40_04315 [Candidatus Paracaedimonas acanthamoebae]